MEDYASVCELLFAVSSEVDATADEKETQQPKFSTTKRALHPMITVPCRGKEDKTLGFTKQENIGAFSAKIKVVLDFEEEEKFAVKDVNGIGLKEKTLCVHAIKSDAAVNVVRLISLQFQKVRGSKRVKDFLNRAAC